MPNWKKVIVSGSDALLNEITSSRGIKSTDVTIDDWGSVSASLASIDSGASNLTLQDITNNGNTTTTDITVVGDITASAIESVSASIDYALINDKLQGNGSGFQFFAYNEDTIKTKFANWYSSNDRQYGMGQLWYETWFAAIDNQAGRDNRRIGFYLEKPDAGASDAAGGTGAHPSNARFYVDINGGYLSGSLNTTGDITGSDITIDAWGSVSSSLSSLNSSIQQSGNGTVTSVGGTGTVSGLSLSGTVTTSGNLTLGGTISISSTNITDVDAFSQSGTYANLRAQATTKGDVGLGNVENTALSTYTGNGGALDNQYITNGAGYSTTTGTVTSVNSEGPDGGGDVNLNTDNIAEGSSNLYYTDGRVKTKLNTENVISGSTFSSPSQGTVRAQINGVNTDVDTGLQVADSPTFDSLTLTGDLTVLGTKTELQVTQLNVEDLNIKVASGSANSAAANGAGLYVDGADVGLFWNHANQRFQFDADLHTNTSLSIGQVFNAGTDTDKFLVLDSNGTVDFRTGTEVYDDIGVTALSSSIADDIEGLSTRILTPIQLTVDTKALTAGFVPWSVLTDLQPNPDRAYTTWIAPTDGFLHEVIVSPEQTNTTTANIRISLLNGGSVVSTTQSVAMAAAGTNKTFTFGAQNYSFSAGDRLSIEFDKLTNTSDLYNVMVVFKMSNV